MKKQLATLALLLLLTVVPLGRLDAAAAAPPASTFKLIVLPIVISSRLSDDWIVQHVQSSLDTRFPWVGYNYIDPGHVADFVRDTGFVAGFGPLPEKEMVRKLARHFAADAVVGLKISKIDYETIGVKLTAISGKEQVDTVIDAVIYTAKDDSFLAYSARKSVNKNLGPFTPYEKDETISAGLDLCMTDIFTNIKF